MTQPQRDQQDNRDDPTQYDIGRYREYLDDKKRRSAFWQTDKTGTIVGIVGAVVNNIVGILTWLGSHFKP